MKEDRKKPVSLQEKIDIFTRYFAEGNESINGKTVFEGHPIGDWAIQIRSDINNNRGNIKPDLKQLKQLFKLGILESQRDSTIDEKIDALVDWKAKNPDIIVESRTERTISYTTEERLKELADREGIPYDEILTKYEKLQRYRDYVLDRASRGKLTKAQRTKCKEGGLGGRFGLPSVIEEMTTKYNIDSELAEHIHKNYGSVEEVINKYRNGELPEEEKYRFVGTLFNTWIDIDNNPNRESYERFIKAIIGETEVKHHITDIGIYSSKKIDETVATLSPIQQEVTREYYGLGNREVKGYDELSEKYDISVEKLKKIMPESRRLLRKRINYGRIHPLSLQQLKTNPYITEEEKIEIGNIEDELWKNNIIIGSNGQVTETKLDYEKILNLPETIRTREIETSKAEMDRKKTQLAESVSIDDMEVSKWLYKRLKEMGIETLHDLIGKTKDDLMQAGINVYSGSIINELKKKMKEYGYVWGGKRGFTKEVEKGITKSVEPGDISIRDIYGLTPKTYSILEREGITSLQELTSRNINQISSISDFRSDSLKRLIAKLQELGYAVNKNGNFVYMSPEGEIEEQANAKASERLETINLSDIGFSHRIHLCLRNGGVTSLQDLVQMSEKDIRNIGNIGEKTFDEIVSKMQQFGYSFTKGRFVYSVPEEEKIEQVTHEPETIETLEQNIEEPQEEKRSESDILKEMKARREQLEQQLAALEEQTKQARELLAEYDKIIGDGKTHTEDETPDFKDE